MLKNKLIRIALFVILVAISVWGVKVFLDQNDANVAVTPYTSSVLANIGNNPRGITIDSAGNIY